MRFEVLGSGGAVVTPRPGYRDSFNQEARMKGIPYQRRGPAVFLHDENILFDTPEDIVESLNRADVDRVAACFYSHWHPDHTMGRRVFEQLNMDMRGGKSLTTDVYVPERVANDMRERLGTWQHLEFEQSIGLIRLHIIAAGEPVTVGDFQITAMPLAEDYVFAYVVERDNKRAIVMMDELHGWSPDATLHEIDLAILPSGVSEFHTVTGERNIPAGDPVLSTEMHFEETTDCIRKMEPGKAVLIHLDEPDRVSYDDGLALDERFRAEGLPITVGYDGLIVEI